MRHVRIANRLVDPRRFRRGFGFSGWLIFVADSLRFFLEAWIVRAIMRQDDPGPIVKNAVEQEIETGRQANPLVADLFSRCSSRYVRGQMEDSDEVIVHKVYQQTPAPEAQARSLEGTLVSTSTSRAARYFQRSRRRVFDVETEEGED